MWGFVNLWQAPFAESVPMHIAPGDDDYGDDDDGDDDDGTDPIDWRTEDILSAAILSTEDFNALEVEVATLLFGDPLLIADGALPVSPTSTGSADVDDDGRMDLTLELSIPEMRENGVIGLLTEEGYVAGEMADGTVIAGRDTVAFVPEPSALFVTLAGLAVLTLRRRW
jgi:hypothetical protein